MSTCADMEAQGSRRYDYVNTAVSTNEPTPTVREVKDDIKHLKSNKSAGKNGHENGPGNVGHLPAPSNSQDPRD